MSSTISQEGIDAALVYGSAVAGGKLRIYAYFREQHTPAERAAFLNNEYGIGGRTHALSGEGSSAEEHDSKGITLTRGPYTNPLVKVHLSWARVAQRIDALIREGRYLSPEEHALVPEPERVMTVPMDEQLSLFGNGQLLLSVDDQQAMIVHETDTGLEEDFLFTDEEIARVKERLEHPTPEDVARLDMLDTARRTHEQSSELSKMSLNKNHSPPPSPYLPSTTASPTIALARAGQRQSTVTTSPPSAP